MGEGGDGRAGMGRGGVGDGRDLRGEERVGGGTKPWWIELTCRCALRNVEDFVELRPPPPLALPCGISPSTSRATSLDASASAKNEVREESREAWSEVSQV